MDKEMHATTILCVRKNKQTVIAADGQVSLGNTIFKSNAKKLRQIADGSIVAGFAGSATDGLTLFERLEAKLSKHSNNLPRACVELAKDWRMDKYLRKLEAMLIVADKDSMFILSGSGDVIEPEDNIASIGSGGVYAMAACKALMSLENNLDAKEIAKRSMEIAASICVFTNNKIIIEEVK
jgi:ATP-dependent HslUV protease subunit HslV